MLRTKFVIAMMGSFALALAVSGGARAESKQEIDVAVSDHCGNLPMPTRHTANWSAKPQEFCVFRASPKPAPESAASTAMAHYSRAELSPNIMV